MCRLHVMLAFGLAPSIALSAGLSIGPDGIDAAGLGLDGTGVDIGMFEQGVPGTDGRDDANLTVSGLVLERTFFGYFGQTQVNQSVTEHANKVAGVLVLGDDPDPDEGVAADFYRGVAPGARLYAAARSGGIDPDPRTLDTLATAVGADIKAINISWGIEPQPIIEARDGNSRLTAFVDWSSRVHDIVYVTAWPNADTLGGGGANGLVGLPSDNYNGMTVASSRSDQNAISGPNGIGGTYDRWSEDINSTPTSVTDAVGPRTTIDLIAPGTKIPTLEGGDVEEISSGSSYATAHVTGTVALMHQRYNENRADPMIPGFSTRSQRHEVMKSILLTSADKLDGVHGSNRDILLPQRGMSVDDETWIDSPAYTSTTQSLDQDIGAGHVNARRAIQLLDAGEQTGQVGSIGWDFGRTGGSGDFIDYAFTEMFSAGSYFSATLVWDRFIELTNPDDDFVSGDQFITTGKTLADLNLRLVKVGDTGAETVWSSSTKEDNVEHIFWEIEESGEYTLIVDHVNDNDFLGDQTRYGVSWWYAETPIDGDYDADGDVDQDDYSQWSNDYGSSVAAGTGSDGNGDGVVNAADYTVWRDAFSSPAISVPEPTSAAMVSLLLVFRLTRRVPSKCSTSRG